METEENKIRQLDAEELESLARRYYAESFPNPQRLGCPPAGEILKVVKQRQLPEQALREHLFECSECFGEYRQALAQCRRLATDKNVWGKLLAWIVDQWNSGGVAKIAVSVSTVLILSLSIVALWRKSAPGPGKDAAQNATASESQAEVRAEVHDAGGAGPATNQTSGAAETAGAAGAAGAAETAKPESDILAIAGPLKSSPGARTIDVDLDNYQVYRNSVKGKPSTATKDRPDREDSKTREEPAVKTYGLRSGEDVIFLPATLARLVLVLPETGVRGKYNVSLIDAFGKPLYTTSAFSPDGSKLRVPLDLRQISTKKCRLRLWRSGEAPAFYNVVIDAK